MGLDIQYVSFYILCRMKIFSYFTVIEGLATVVAGVASFWIIQDFPDTAKFLSEAERTVVIRRLQGDDQFSAAGEKLRMKYIWASLKDWKTWVGSMLHYALSFPCGDSNDRRASDRIYGL